MCPFWSTFWVWHCEEENNEILSHDWNASARKLGLCARDIKECEEWVDHQSKICSSSTNSRDKEKIDPHQLNEKQRMSYTILKNWADKRFDDPSVKPMFLKFSGWAGCGKSIFLMSLKDHIVEKAGPNLIKTAAPTGTTGYNCIFDWRFNIAKFVENKS